MTKIIAIVAILLLASCGGGSGSNTQNSEPTTVPPPSPPVTTPPVEPPVVPPVVPPTMQEIALNKINEARASGRTCGSTLYPATTAVKLNEILNNAALAHSVDMANNNYFDHVGLNGSNFWDRAWAAGYKGQPLGENIAAGVSSPVDAVNLWLTSAGHCANIMNSAANDIGIGNAISNTSQWGSYWTLILGRS